MTEVNPPKAIGGSSVTGAAPIMPIGLPSRFEVTGGTDRLFFAPGLQRQASLFGEARYRLSDLVQFGASGTARYQGDIQASELALQLLAGPTFNFGDGPALRNAFFISPKAGITAWRTSLNGKVLGTGNAPTFSFIAGKRFALSDHLAFAPSIGAVRDTHHPAYVTVVPVAISFFF
jgi:hypothetical protein